MCFSQAHNIICLSVKMKDLHIVLLIQFESSYDIVNLEHFILIMLCSNFIIYTILNCKIR